MACRSQQPKRSLVRIVRTGAGAVVIDSTGKASGRGAYLCPRDECWQLALRKDVLARALKSMVPPDDRLALEAHAARLAGQDGVEADRAVARGS